MLNREEKEEFVKDGLDVSRREAFRKARESDEGCAPSLDAYMKFLAGVRKVFTSLDPTFKKPVTRLNRL